MELIKRTKRPKTKHVATINYQSSNTPCKFDITKSRVTTYCDELTHSSCSYDYPDNQRYPYIESIGESTLD